jgi:hypothetical protein
MLCLDLYQNGVYVMPLASQLWNYYDWTIPSGIGQTNITSGIANLFLSVCRQKWINVTSESFYLMMDQYHVGALHFKSPVSQYSQYGVGYTIQQQGYVMTVEVQIPEVLILYPVVVTLYEQSGLNGGIKSTMQHTYVCCIYRRALRILFDDQLSKKLCVGGRGVGIWMNCK